jgi:hypothetical protein
MIRRLVYVMFFLVIVVAVAFSSCSHKNVDQNPATATESQEGWINDDTYQIAAGGIPISSLLLIDQKKESARIAAMLNARCQIIDTFIGYKIKLEDLKNNGELEEIPIHEELKAVVKAGIIKKTVWDYNANCEIVYEVKYPGLKKKVDDGVWKQ